MPAGSGHLNYIYRQWTAHAGGCMPRSFHATGGMTSRHAAPRFPFGGMQSLFTDGEYIFHDGKHIFTDVIHIFNVVE